MIGVVLLAIFVPNLVTSELSISEEDFQDGVLRAQCIARCLHKYGTQPVELTDDIYSRYRHKICHRNACRQCEVACNSTAPELGDCDTLCDNKTACVNSCHFVLNHMVQNHEDDEFFQDVISKPWVHCMNIPYSRHGDSPCRENDASIYLKWKVVGEAVEESVVFVVAARKTDYETDSSLEWKVMKVTSKAFVRISSLSCGTKYKFKVTPVSRVGIAGKAREIDWTATPSEPLHLKPPRNFRVASQTQYNQRPSAVIAWDEQEDAACFYRVYWLSKGASEEEIKAPPEFKYQIKGLKFSTNYTLRLYSYDEKYRKGSKEGATTFLVTPDCLTATKFNYTACAPEAPMNIRMTVLTPNAKDHSVEYVNISLSWDPPPHMNNGEEITDYVIEWRKEPPIHAGHLIVPHHGTMQINATKSAPPDTSVILHELHNHNQYSILLAASTLGGQGKVGKRSISLGLPITTDEEPMVKKEDSAPLKLWPQNDVFFSSSCRSIWTVSRENVSSDITDRGDSDAPLRNGTLIGLSLVYCVNGTRLSKHRVQPENTDQTMWACRLLFAGVGTVRLKPGELAAVVVVPTGLSLTLVLVAFFVVCRRKDKYKHYASPRRFGPVEELNPIYDGIGSCSVPCDDGKLSQEMDDFEIDHNCLNFIGVLGEGAFGKVVKAEYTKNLSDKGQGSGKIVAVKMLRDVYTADELRHFKLEIEAMKTLGSHPHLVSIIGCCLTGPKMCLVMDFCALGDLRNYLRKYREKMMYSSMSPYVVRTALPSDDSESPLVGSDSGISQESEEKVLNDHSLNSDEISEVQLLSYARQITMGMEFLEQRKFVHRDLAARNTLLYDKRHLKISDFGLTRDVYETNMYQPTSARKLPYKWMALESLFSQEFTIKSDVWSFGIVLWEIVTLGGSPYPSIPLKDLYGLLNDGYRMERPENCSPNIYQIMLSCWHPNPVSRPSFTELRSKLESLLEEKQSYIDLSVEVSGDYFSSDSTIESKSSSVINQMSTEPTLDTENGEENIHKDQITCDDPLVDVDVQTHGDFDNNSHNASTVQCDEVFLDNDSKTKYCLFNLDNSLNDKNQNIDILTNNNKKCDCVLCINRDSIKSNRSNRSSVPPLKHKATLRDSLRCIIDKVGKTNKLFSPLSRKRSVSLTDMDREGKFSIHL